jgi:triosephosphate isomerase
MRAPFICANWKMYKTVDETVKYVKEFRALAKDLDGIEIVLAPPFIAVYSAAEAARNSNVGIAAQDMFWEREGAYTGEVSGAMLREAGVEYVIVGHSERRTLFGETDVTVGRKITAAFAAGLCPIACIGETLDQRERQETFDVLDRQIKIGLDGLTSERIAQLVIAYEPVWAIGTGRNATPAQATEVHAHIRTRLRQWFGQDSAELCHVIYGGSVKPDNIADLTSQPDVDGALVGGASLDVRSFRDIVVRSRQAARTRQAQSGGQAGAV